MKWISFKSAAYPPAFSVTEKDKSVIFHMNRWLGLRFAYLFYHLGFSANLLSILRVALAAFGLYLVFYYLFSNIFVPVIGVLLLAWQVNLDFADGAIARVTSKSSVLGEKLDGLANDFSRGAVLILISSFSSHYYMIIISIFTVFILIKFFAETFAIVTTNNSWERYPLFISIIRILLFVPVMVVGLPLLTMIAKLGDGGRYIYPFSITVTVLYAVLAVSWLFIAAKSKSH